MSTVYWTLPLTGRERPQAAAEQRKLKRPKQPSTQGNLAAAVLRCATAYATRRASCAFVALRRVNLAPVAAMAPTQISRPESRSLQ